jgi:putative endonuclease
MYTLYILRCANKALYTGITNNLSARLKKHSLGKGSKYVWANSPFELVYTEQLEDKSSALKREAEVKRLTKLEKEELIIKTQP